MDEIKKILKGLGGEKMEGEIYEDTLWEMLQDNTISLPDIIELNVALMNAIYKIRKIMEEN